MSFKRLLRPSSRLHSFDIHCGVASDRFFLGSDVAMSESQLSMHANYMRMSARYVFADCRLSQRRGASASSVSSFTRLDMCLRPRSSTARWSPTSRSHSRMSAKSCKCLSPATAARDALTREVQSHHEEAFERILARLGGDGVPADQLRRSRRRRQFPARRAQPRPLGTTRVSSRARTGASITANSRCTACQPVGKRLGRTHAAVREPRPLGVQHRST